MTLGRRVAKLEAGAGFGRAPAACWIHTGAESFVYLSATEERIPKVEFDRRWPNAPVLKAYGDARMVNALEADWADAPPPRSSADV
jgi:hypothetical protein